MRSSPTTDRSDPIQVVLGEWEDRVLPGVQLSNEGRALAARLAAGAGSLEIDELRDGLRVRTRSWVGVVGLDGLDIRIEPKLPGDQIALVRLIERTLGLDGLRRLHGRSALDFSGGSLLDLIALLFAESCSALLRLGLRVGYIEKEEALPVVRGRILADRQILDRFGQMDRILCRFDELEHDVDENRLIAAALRVTSRRVAVGAVRRRLSRLRAVFEPICNSHALDLRTLRTRMSEHFYDRLNSHYREAHQLAWLLLDGLGIDDLSAPGTTSSFSFLIDMNPMFERLVELLVQHVLPPQMRVASQSKQSSILWNVTAHRSYASVIPDLVIRSISSQQRALPIDAKYKLYGERRVDPSDLYQTFLYAYALSKSCRDLPPTSLIVYPSTTREPKTLRVRVQPDTGRQSAEILALGLYIPDALDDLDTRTSRSSSAQRLRKIVHSLMAETGAEERRIGSMPRSTGQTHARSADRRSRSAG